MTTDNAPADTAMTAHGTEDFIIFAYRDRNGLTHLLTRWTDGKVTFSWDWRDNGKPGDPYKYFPGVEVTNPALQKLAEAWLEYLDAVVEKGWYR